jgi:ABC-2 type transport system permease protein
LDVKAAERGRALAPQGEGSNRIAFGVRLQALMARAFGNPIVAKELRCRMRGWRAPLVLTVYLLILSAFASIVYLVVSNSLPFAGGGAIGPRVGQALFYSTYLLLLLLVVFLSPAFTAGAVSGERERRTLDLLTTTLLSTRALVLGKWVSALAYILLLIVAALPVHSLAFTFGGIAFSEVVVGALILLAAAFTTGAIGMFVSTLFRSTIASTVVTYATVLLTAMGMPLLVLLFGIVLGNAGTASLNRLSWAWQAALIYGGGFLVVTNPFATAVATKIVLDQERTWWFFAIELTEGGARHQVPLISPWIVYLALCALACALLIGSSVAILRRRRG